MKTLAIILTSYGILVAIGSVMMLDFPGLNFIISIMMAPLFSRLSIKDIFQVLLIQNVIYFLVHPNSLIYALTWDQSITPIFIIAFPFIVIWGCFVNAVVSKLFARFSKKANILRRIGY